MEHIGAVPVEVIANFPKVRELCSMGFHVNPPNYALPADPRLLCRALEDSQVVTVSDDGKWIIPKTVPNVPNLPNAGQPQQPNDRNNEPGGDGIPEAPPSPSSQTTSNSSAGVPTFPIQSKERTTVIVRDLPIECTEGEVMEALSTESGRPKSARLEVGNTWYISFQTEAQAVAAVSDSREKEIRGTPIRAGIKSEVPNATTTPSSLPQQRPPQQAFTPPQPYFPFATHHPGLPAYHYLPAYGMHMSHASMGFPPQPQVMPPHQQPHVAGPPFANMHPSAYSPHPVFMNSQMNRPTPSGIPGIVPVETKGNKKRQKQKKGKDRNRGNNNHAGEWRRREDRIEEQPPGSMKEERGQQNSSPSGSDGSGSRRSTNNSRRRKSGRKQNQKQQQQQQQQQQQHANGQARETPKGQMLTEENFPALGGDPSSKKNEANNKTHFGGYVQALLKTSTKGDIESDDFATYEIENGIARHSIVDEPPDTNAHDNDKSDTV